MGKGFENYHSTKQASKPGINPLHRFFFLCCWAVKKEREDAWSTPRATYENTATNERVRTVTISGAKHLRVARPHAQTHIEGGELVADLAWVPYFVICCRAASRGRTVGNP